MNPVGSRLAGETCGAGEDKYDLVNTIPKAQGDIEGIAGVERDVFDGCVSSLRDQC